MQFTFITIESNFRLRLGFALLGQLLPRAFGVFRRLSTSILKYLSFARTGRGKPDSIARCWFWRKSKRDQSKVEIVLIDLYSRSVPVVALRGAPDRQVGTVTNLYWRCSPTSKMNSRTMQFDSCLEISSNSDSPLVERLAQVLRKIRSRTSPLSNSRMVKVKSRRTRLSVNKVDHVFCEFTLPSLESCPTVLRSIDWASERVNRRGEECSRLSVHSKMSDFSVELHRITIIILAFSAISKSKVLRRRRW